MPRSLNKSFSSQLASQCTDSVFGDLAKGCVVFRRPPPPLPALIARDDFGALKCLVVVCAIINLVCVVVPGMLLFLVQFP